MESFEKLDLQLNVELWFTENDYRPSLSTSSSQPSSPAPSTGQQSNENNFANMLMSMTAATNTNNNQTSQTSQQQQQQTSSLNGSSTNLQSASSNGGNAASSNPLQQLCVRTFKIKFDPRRGIHLQIPVLFDYFHLSAVMMTLHCTLLTLLPPVMLGYVFSFPFHSVTFFFQTN